MFKFVRLRFLSTMCFFSLVIGCASNHQQMDMRGRNWDDDAGLRLSLASVRGRFDWIHDKNYYIYSERPILIQRVLEYSNEGSRDALPGYVLDALVGCLDDFRPSRSKFGDKEVPLGLVCHAALTSFIYHEEVSAQGDIVQNWAGYPSLPVSRRSLAAAKTEWRKALESKQYSYF